MRWSAVLPVLLLGALGSASASPCPANWAEFENSCYVVTVADTFEGTRNDCVSQGGDLAAISSVRSAVVVPLCLISLTTA